MEKFKLWLDVAIVVFGLLAAIAAIVGLIIGNRIDYAKELEEKQWQAKIAESSAQAEKAKEEAAMALSSAASMNERANALELETETQKERAAIAEKQLLELTEKLKPRKITAEQHWNIVADLRKSPRGKINISSPLGNTEALMYANQFLKIFEEVRWEVSTGIGRSSLTGAGVFIITPNESDINAINIQKIFSRHGLNVHGQLEKNFPADHLNLFIGDKPQN